MRPQVIFVHGMWSRPWVWDLWKPRFEAAGYTCIAVSLPGHAATDTDRELQGLGLSDYTGAVAGIASQFERPVLVGHSMGGLIAQQVAARLPLTAAVLVNSAAPAPIFPLRPSMLPGLVRHFSKWGLWRNAFRLSGWEARYLLFNAVPREEQAALVDRLIAESGRIAYELGFGALNRAGTNRVSLSSLNCRLLALAGSRDHIIPAAVSRNMAAWYGQRMTYREYAGHGHWMIGEPQWQQRADEVLSWLEKDRLD
jgi:pimeloyl-ACP methyl ester carboxylesterase